MKNINTKSILECNEHEEELHNHEIKKYCDTIYEISNYETAILIQRVDIEVQEEIIKSCKLHDFMDMVEYVDNKNGIDLYYDDKEILTIMAYGQGYEMNGKHYMVKTKIKVLPYNDSREFLNLRYLFDSLGIMN